MSFKINLALCWLSYMEPFYVFLHVFCVFYIKLQLFSRLGKLYLTSHRHECD